MQIIKPFGKFFPLEKGYIINPTALDKIPSHWLSALAMVQQSYQEHLGQNLHSLWLRGSLPRGLAVDYIADIDVFALVCLPNIRWQSTDFETDLNQNIQALFPFIKQVECMMSSFEKDFYTYNPRLSFILQTQSLCLHGIDIRVDLPNFQISSTMMLNKHWLSADIQELLEKRVFTKEDCKNVMKVVIRSGFELVMEREGQYTPDLYLCYQTFSKYYPEQEHSMRTCLHYFLNPVESSDKFKDFLKAFGNWLVAAF